MEYHEPVLLTEVLEGLAVRGNGKYLDLTLGGGGHSKKILEKLNPDAGMLIGIDRDSDALAYVSKLFGHPENFRTIKGDFGESSTWDNFSDLAFDGILMDLGVSSYQLDESERGFSFRNDAALDMRMDRDQVRTAADAVNSMDKRTLADMIYQYGEERRSRGIAAKIIDSRPFSTTVELAEIVRSCFPASERRKMRIDPATRTFQAIRIWVNDEMGALERGLAFAVEHLVSGGRLTVISYHSLEDRIVKNFIALESKDCICPPEFPVCVCGHKASLAKVSRKVITATEEEKAVNPRSRSAKLRVARRL